MGWCLSDWTKAAPVHIRVLIPRLSSHLLCGPDPPPAPTLIFPPAASLPLASLRLVGRTCLIGVTRFLSSLQKLMGLFFFQSCLHSSSVSSLFTIFNVISDVSNSFQFSSVQLFSCVWLCNPMDRSTPGLPVHQQLPEFTQTHVHWVGDAIQPSHPLLSPSLPAFNLSQHQGLFRWVSSLHQVAKVLEFQLQHQSFQWLFRTDLL